MRIKAYLKSQNSRLVNALARAGSVNLTSIANQRLGILQHHNNHVSGEQHFISKVLPALLYDAERPVLFDVGLNEGGYSLALLEAFPRSSLYGFEPVEETIRRARKRLAGKGNVTLENVAVSDVAGEIEIFDYAEGDGSSHASAYKGVITEQHRSSQVVSHSVKPAVFTECV